VIVITETAVLYCTGFQQRFSSVHSSHV